MLQINTLKDNNMESVKKQNTWLELTKSSNFGKILLKMNRKRGVIWLKRKALK